MLQAALVLEKATLQDLNSLNALEQSCFSADRLSRRQLKHYISFEHSLLLTAKLVWGTCGLWAALVAPRNAAGKALFIGGIASSSR